MLKIVIKATPLFLHSFLPQPIPCSFYKFVRAIPSYNSLRVGYTLTSGIYFEFQSMPASVPTCLDPKSSPHPITNVIFTLPSLLKLFHSYIFAPAYYLQYVQPEWISPCLTVLQSCCVDNVTCIYIIGETEITVKPKFKNIHCISNNHSWGCRINHNNCIFSLLILPQLVTDFYWN